MEVCERASSTDTNAKEAVRALRRDFKFVDFDRVFVLSG